MSLLSEPDIIDLVTVDETTYAIVTKPRAVPDCIALPVANLSTRLRDFIARGYSHRHRKPYAAVAGVFAWTLVTYSLEALAPSRKQTFSHALMGTAMRSGLLSQWGGEKLGRGAFITPAGREHDVTAFLTHWCVPYTREVIFRER